MSLTRLLLSSAVASSLMLGAGMAAAQSRVPAEIPSASFAGSQYVDSKGCVYIRAGSGGTVTWVPRMDRSRNQLCNARPTGGANSGTTTTASTTVAGSVTRITPATQPTQVRATPPRITFRPNVASTPAPRIVPATPPVATAPRIITPRAPQTVRRVVRATPTVQRPAAMAPRQGAARPASTSCRGISALSAQYTNRGQYGPVRCGPQAVHPADYAQANAARDTPRYSGLVRAPFEPVNPSPQTAWGYRALWADGRLNPYRGARGSVSAAAASTGNLMWTSYAPHRLIDLTTGQDVTARYPNLRPPVQAATRAATTYNFAPIATSGGYVPTMSSRGEPAARAVAPQRPTAGAVAGAARVQPAAPQSVRVGRGHRFVQLGTYADPANVQRAIDALHRLGLPAAKQGITRGGRRMEAVLSGPFPTPQALGNALVRARSAGFSDAITRK